MQIDLTVESGSRMAGWALRTFRGRGKQLMLTLLRSLVQPRLDYCSQLWSPRDQFSINKLEGVQRQFLTQIRDPVLAKMSYWEKLSHLRVYSTEIWRAIVFAYNLGITHLCINQFGIYGGQIVCIISQF